LGLSLKISVFGARKCNRGRENFRVEYNFIIILFWTSGIVLYFFLKIYKNKNTFLKKKIESEWDICHPGVRPWVFSRIYTRKITSLQLNINSIQVRVSCLEFFFLANFALEVQR
jgi:hypothetical protein